jgi:hypothetical protein
MGWLKNLLIEEGHDEPQGWLDRKDRDHAGENGSAPTRE